MWRPAFFDALAAPRPVGTNPSRPPPLHQDYPLAPLEDDCKVRGG
jgi:hypothetical protein